MFKQGFFPHNKLLAVIYILELNMKYWFLLISFLLISCGQDKESCTDVKESILLIEENSSIQRDKLSDLESKLADETNDEWKKTISKTISLTKKKIEANNVRVREINRKNQQCYSS